MTVAEWAGIKQDTSMCYRARLDNLCAKVDALSILQGFSECGPA